ncbi:hypothetical protein AB0F24_25925 [Streptomyces platensis]|uniref:hypothetical protein n=1 Tax=Streptomyces platensis TaxID=58346 RepID=UPI0033E0B2AB
MTTNHTIEPGEWIRVITLRQPWATCVLAGKDVENRPRPWFMSRLSSEHSI